MADGILTPSNVACGSGIMTVNSPSGSKPTLQRDTWFWDDMPLNSSKHPPYWNSTSGFDFGHTTAVDNVILRQSLKFYPNRTTHGIKMRLGLYRFSKWQISAILDFMGPIMGSLKSPCTTSYRSSIETMALNCLVFEKIAFFLYFGDRQTDKQTNRWTAPKH